MNLFPKLRSLPKSGTKKISSWNDQLCWVMWIHVHFHSFFLVYRVYSTQMQQVQSRPFLEKRFVCIPFLFFAKMHIEVLPIRRVRFQEQFNEPKKTMRKRFWYKKRESWSSPYQFGHKRTTFRVRFFLYTIFLFPN